MNDNAKKILIPFVLMIIFNLGTYYFSIGENFGEGFYPHVGLLIISALLFGPYGAAGSVLGKTLCDMIRGYSFPWILVSEIIAFGISYLAYKLWYVKIKSRVLVKPRLNNTTNIILFFTIVLICSLLYTLINKEIFYLLYPQTIPINGMLGIEFFVNLINSAFIFGIIGIWISKRIDYVHIPKISGRKLNKKLYALIGIILIIATCATLILDYCSDQNMTINALEVMILSSLIYLLTTIPITEKIHEVTYNSITERIMNIFLLTTLIIILLGLIFALNEIPIAMDILDSHDIPLVIMIISDFLLVIFFIPSIFILRYVENEVANPIMDFSKIEKYVKKGDKIESEGLIELYSKYINENDEIGILARSYTDLINYTNEYIENIREVESEKERIKTELEIAEKIQKSNLPTKSIENNDYTICGFSKPAKEVGGDFYDYYPLDEDNVAVMIGDASGKGVPAALLSRVAQSIIKLLLKSERDPSKVLYSLNNQLYENNPEVMFVALWIGIYNNKTKKITFSNAGHDFPLIMEDGNFKSLGINHGIVLGVMKDFEFKKEEVSISNGLIIYTDGITDAKNSNNEFYGKDRLIDFLNLHASEDNLINKLLGDINEFTGTREQFDDMTLVYLDRHD